MKRGEQYLDVGDFGAAYAYFDWTIVGRHDQREQFNATYAACCRWKAGSREEGGERWRELARESPNAILARARFVRRLTELGYDTAVPGSEPTEPDKVGEFIEANPQLWSDEARQRFMDDMAEMSTRIPL